MSKINKSKVKSFLPKVSECSDHFFFPTREKSNKHINIALKIKWRQFFDPEFDRLSTQKDEDSYIIFELPKI